MKRTLLAATLAAALVSATAQAQMPAAPKAAAPKADAPKAAPAKSDAPAGKTLYTPQQYDFMIKERLAQGQQQLIQVGIGDVLPLGDLAALDRPLAAPLGQFQQGADAVLAPTR